MPGRMGNQNVTVYNLQVYKIDHPRNLIYVRGAVPGPKKAVVTIRDALYTKLQHRILPFPTWVPEEGKEMPDVEVMDPGTVDPYDQIFMHENETLRTFDE